MRHFIKTLAMVAALVLITSAAWAQGETDLQLISIQGKIIGPEGQALEEYDYIKAGLRYRLLPQSQAELSSLDGLTTFSVKGPGILEINAEGVTLNGKPVYRSGAQTLLGSVKAADGGNQLAGLAMRGNQGVVLNLPGPKGRKKALPLYSGYYALVIGAGAYRAGWPSLPNPPEDAKKVASTLKSLGWEVDTLLDPDAESLRQKLNQLIIQQGRKKNKAILVWYSGHGHTLVEADGSKLGYIVPVDAPNPNKDELGFMAKGISMRQVETVARRIQAKHVLMVFDSCFSGAIFSLSRAVPSPYIEEKVSQPVRQFITAGSENEKVPDASVFTTVFIQGLKQNEADLNRDGYVTGEELGSYLQEKVVNYSNKTQHPQFGKINNPHLDKGDFVFAPLAKPKAQATTAASQGPVSTGKGDKQKRITVLLRSAEANFKAGRLTSPPGSNAFANYNKVLALDPLNKEAREGLKLIVGKYVDLARARLKLRDYERTEQYLRRASQVSEADKRVLETWDQLKAARQAKPSAKGVSPKADRPAAVSTGGRFTRDAQGVISDKRTGLQWKVGPDKDLNWHQSKAWAEKLTGGGWRLPTRKEVQGIYQKGQSETGLPIGFETTGSWIWSGDVYQDEHGYSNFKIYQAWLFELRADRWMQVDPENKSDNRVLAVRTAPKAQTASAPGLADKAQAKSAASAGPPKKIAPFGREQSGVITDSQNGLLWRVGPDEDIDWPHAKAWVDKLDPSGGWRLPSKQEISGIFQKGGGADALSPLFKTSGDWLWSGEVIKDEYGYRNYQIQQVWIFNLKTGEWMKLAPSMKADLRVFAVRPAGK